MVCESGSVCGCDYDADYTAGVCGSKVVSHYAGADYTWGEYKILVFMMVEISLLVYAIVEEKVTTVVILQRVILIEKVV